MMIKRYKDGIYTSVEIIEDDLDKEYEENMKRLRKIKEEKDKEEKDKESDNK